MNNKIILRIIELSASVQFILFGSQTQGTNNANSDFDWMILNNNK